MSEPTHDTLTLEELYAESIDVMRRMKEALTPFVQSEENRKGHMAALHLAFYALGEYGFLNECCGAESEHVAGLIDVRRMLLQHVVHAHDAVCPRGAGVTH